VVSKQTFSYVDHYVFQATWMWSIRRHPNKAVDWVKRKYFRREGSRDWVFGGQTVGRNGAVCFRTLVHASDTAIRRHIKVRSDAIPYSSLDEVYFANRADRRFHYYLPGVAPLWLTEV
jgi:RNA-directed DNA polymerase